MDAIYAHAHVDDIDLDARSSESAKAKQAASNALGNWQAISITFATTVGLFICVTLTLQPFVWLGYHAILFAFLQHT